MEIDTIPDPIWEHLTITTESILREKGVSHWTDPSTKKKAEVVIRVSNMFYGLYSIANRSLAYSSNFTGEKDVGWNEFAAIVAREGDRGFRPHPEPKPSSRWIPDSNAVSCKLCNEKFKLWVRKHHCRLCGEVVCDNCSKQEMDVLHPLTETGRETGNATKRVRVCRECHQHHTNTTTWDRKRPNPGSPWETWDKSLKKGPSEENKKEREKPLTDFWLQTNKGDRSIYRARLGMKFKHDDKDTRNLKGRIQFVVKSGGGIVLYSRLDRSFKAFALNNGVESLRAFQAYKVFSEEFGEGRGDSAVVYLYENSNHKDVTAWWEQALQDGTFKSSLNTDAQAYGLRKMTHGGWAIDLPGTEKERQVLPEVKPSGGSAGGLIGNMIGLSFYNAGLDIVDSCIRKGMPRDLVKLRPEWVILAKKHFIKINKRLFPGP